MATSAPTRRDQDISFLIRMYDAAVKYDMVDDLMARVLNVGLDEDEPAASPLTPPVRQLRVVASNPSVTGSNREPLKPALRIVSRRPAKRRARRIRVVGGPEVA
jgi:hypothetical protein